MIAVSEDQQSGLPTVHTQVYVPGEVADTTVVGSLTLLKATEGLAQLQPPGTTSATALSMVLNAHTVASGPAFAVGGLHGFTGVPMQVQLTCH